MTEPDHQLKTDPAWLAERAARRGAEAIAERLARLQAATAALSGARTPDEVAEVALREGLAAVGGTCGFLAVPGAGGGELDVLRAAGMPDAAAHRSTRVDVPGPMRDAWRNGAPVFIPDGAELVRRYPALAPMAERMCGGGEAVAALPLLVPGRILGVLSIGFDGTRRFPEDERAFAMTLAGQCAQALDRARLFVAERLARAEAVTATRRLAFLDGLSALLAGTLDEREMLAGVVRLAVPALADFAGVFAPGEGGALELAASAGDDKTASEARALLAGCAAEALARVAAGGDPVALDCPGGGTTASPHAVAVVPLAVGGRSLGALALASLDPVRRYGASDLALLLHVARRTALAVDHARLLRDAQIAATAREEFLHVASHELRGPIGSLRMAVQLLRRDVDRGKDLVEGRLAVIERQAERLVRLGDTMLDVSRITAGRLELDREEVDLAALARGVALRLADEAADAGSPIAVDAPAPVRCVADPARVEQVISNLLSNAVKYGRGAPVALAIRAASWGAVVEVRDRGIGIAPEDQGRIFDRFERAVSVRHYGGLGLGLWIAKRIADAHGGTIRVESAAGEGSTFTLELPGASAGG